MEQDSNAVEKVYDAVAQEWAVAFSGEHDQKPKDQEMLRRFAQEIGPRRPVWDFGCGPGNTAQYLKNLGVEISGLDLSAKMLEQARRLHPGIPFLKGDMLALEFAGHSIAGVVAFYAIVHFTQEQAEAALREVFRVLQPGGLFLFTFHVGGKPLHLEEFLGKKVDVDFMFFTTDFMARCLKTLGFERVEMIERDPYPGVEYASRRAYVFASKP